MRPLDLVIDAVVKTIPDTYTDKAAVAAQLESVKESFLFAAPELRPEWWYKFGLLLNKTFGEPDTDWKKTISELAIGTKDYQEVLDA